jgi:carbon-monoxide dehydrogenase medium subunit
MNLRLAKPPLLVDINGVAGLDAVVERDGGVAIGATARQVDVERSALVASRCPLVTDALRWVAHPQLRNRGTFVGSLVHHDPAGELPAIAVALDAVFTLRHAIGSRTVSAAEFFVTHYTTDVRPGELVSEVWFPALPDGTGTAFAEIARRRGDFALAGVGVALQVGDGIVGSARIAMCGMGERPVRCRAVERSLAGVPADPVRFATAVGTLDDEDGLDPLDDIHAPAHYRRRVAPILLERALAEAAARTN